MSGEFSGHRRIQVEAVREAVDKFFKKHVKPLPPGSID
jgi:hypothetical protein